MKRNSVRAAWEDVSCPGDCHNRRKKYQKKKGRKERDLGNMPRTYIEGIQAGKEVRGNTVAKA